MAPNVLVSKLSGGVGILTLNRPNRLNTWTLELQTELFDGLDNFAKDMDVRVIVVTGSGKAFCAGAAVVGRGSKGETAQNKEGAFPDSEGRLPGVHATLIPKPVICAINGPVAGVGLAFALSADFRFAVRNAKITCAFSKLGLAAEHGLSFRLPRLVGTGRAMMLLMSSDVITAEEGARFGIVERIFDTPDQLREGAVEYARTLAANAPGAALAAIKQQVWRHPGWKDEDAYLSTSRLTAAANHVDGDIKEGVLAFIQKRKPKWGPPTAGNLLLRAIDKEFGSDVGGTSRL